MIPSKPKTKSSSRDLSEPALASRTFEATGQRSWWSLEMLIGRYGKRHQEHLKTNAKLAGEEQEIMSRIYA